MKAGIVAAAANSREHVSEAPVGVWIWLGMAVLFNVIWISADVWLYRHGYELLTTEFKEGLRDPFWAAVIYFVTFGSIAAFLGHMWSTR